MSKISGKNEEATDYSKLLRDARQRATHEQQRAARRELAAEGSDHPNATPVYLIAAGLCVLVLMAGGAAWTLLSREGKDKAAAPPPAAEASPALPSEVVAAFLAAKTDEERLRHIRHPRHAGPVMEAFYRAGLGSLEKVAGIGHMSEPTIGQALLKRPFTMSARYAVKMEDGSKRLLCTVEENGETKVDFLAYARHPSVSWDSIMDGFPEATVRVVLQHGTQYFAAFSDEAVWQAYAATCPEIKEELRFYARRDSPAGKALASLPPGTPRRLLRIAPMGGSHSSRQFEIKEVLSPDWLEPVPKTNP